MSLIHQIALTLINGVGPITAKQLLNVFGSPEAIFAATAQQLLDVEGIGSLTAREILHTDALAAAEKQVKLIEKHKIRPLFYTDEAYPQRLRNCYDAPVLLYYKGTANLNQARIVSIVGTRMASPYGLKLCKDLAETLQHYGVLVISGLAYGIDVAAHQQSLMYNIPTVGVLAHGLDRLYPYAHRAIANQMLNAGGLLTEFPFHTNPDKENFPKRNRIIAGLADATVVIEAAERGGALITAEIASSYHRDVFAFPGRATDVYSRGCNHLIKTNRAALINDPRDLAYYLGWELKQLVPSVLQTEMSLGLAGPEVTILDLLRVIPLRIDALCLQAGMPQSKLAVHLLNLEMKGMIRSLPGKVYELV